MHTFNFTGALAFVTGGHLTEDKWVLGQVPVKLQHFWAQSVAGARSWAGLDLLPVKLPAQIPVTFLAQPALCQDQVAQLPWFLPRQDHRALSHPLDRGSRRRRASIRVRATAMLLVLCVERGLPFWPPLPLLPPGPLYAVSLTLRRAFRVRLAHTAAGIPGQALPLTARSPSRPGPFSPFPRSPSPGPASVYRHA